MQEIRPLLHEILNALAIARGLCEGVQSSLEGDLEMELKDKIGKLSRSIKAMDRIEDGTKEVRRLVLEKFPE